MVMDADDGVVVLLAKCAYNIVCALLHLGVGALNCVQLNAAAITTSLNRAYTATTKTNTIVLATHNNNLVARLRLSLQTVALGTITNTTGKHDNLVVGISLIATLLVVLEGEYGTADKWLAKLVAEVTGTIRSLDKNLLGGLVQPFANGQNLFPLLHTCIIHSAQCVALQARIAGHVNSSTSNGHRTNTTTHTVADFTTATS